MSEATILISKTFDQTFVHHTANINDIQLHYVIGGSGDPVVLLHGWPTTWYEWRKIMPTLAEHYTVIAPDLRGMGDSDKPENGYDGQNLAEDIYQLVHFLGYERIFLVGHDLGAIPAYAYAAAHPNDVRRLAILDMVLPGFGLEEFVQERNPMHFSFHETGDLALALTTGRERIYLSYIYQRDSFQKTAIADTDIDEYVRCYSAPNGMRGGFAHYWSLSQTSQQNRDRVAQGLLPMPVLAIGAEQSLGDLTLRSMQQVATTVRGEIIQQCGHYISEEQPEQLAEHLLTFFAEA
jgi:pimeloyl-ACP methyl ester carboxylesterase